MKITDLPIEAQHRANRRMQLWAYIATMAYVMSDQWKKWRWS